MTLHKLFQVLLLVIVVTAATAAAAGEIKVISKPTVTPVVELYTSEGCSSCPPADRWVTQLGDTLSDEFHAIPLAFHVDYWNRLGWPDPYSDKSYTERQRYLASLNRQRSIYTPEFLVSGEETRGTDAVVDAITAANERVAKAMITLGVTSNDGAALDANVMVTNTVPGAQLYLAIYENNIVREIGGGENAGRTLHHNFVVRHWQRVEILDAGQYDGNHRIVIDADWNRNNIGLATVLFDPISGETLQALSAPLAEAFAQPAS